MTQIVIVFFCASFALITGLSLFRARRTGTIRSRGWKFDRATSPTGFWLVAAIDAIILLASVLVALHALGAIGAFPSKFTI